MSEEKIIKVEIEGDEITYKTKVSPEVAVALIHICVKDQGNSNIPISSTILPNSMKESLAEYVNSKSPQRNPDKILAIAGHLRNTGRENFSPEDIRPYFPKIGEPVPANFGRDFRWATIIGWIAEDPSEPNQFYITSSGIKVLDSNFAKEVIKNTTKRRARGKKKMKPEVA